MIYYRIYLLKKMDSRLCGNDRKVPKELFAEKLHKAMLSAQLLLKEDKEK